jgi:tetraacyldisaccharide 4'-kinase
VTAADRAGRALVTGEWRGPLAATLRFGLLLLTPLYRLALALRAIAYRLRILRVRRPSIPVVSVGNLTAGGTGKSPFVAWVVRRLLRAGKRPAVVSRGYRARPGESSDEGRMFRRAVPGILHVENAERHRGVERAAAEGAGVAVLDDAFQHRRCARDLDLVLVDATDPFGGGHLLPRGLLREPLGALRRADAIVVTRADQVEPGVKDRIVARLERAAPGRPVALARHAPVGVRPLLGAGASPPSALAGRRVLALSGLGRPAAFERTLADLGAEVVATARFPDHHVYDVRDVERVRRQAEEARAEAIVTTAKDAVKLEDAAPEGGEPEILVLDVEIEILAGGEELERALLAAAGVDE